MSLSIFILIAAASWLTLYTIEEVRNIQEMRRREVQTSSRKD